jgi:hypothetical protein
MPNTARYRPRDIGFSIRSSSIAGIYLISRASLLFVAARVCGFRIKISF